MTYSKTYAERHIEDLLEVVDDLMSLPELICPEPDELFDDTLEILAKARTVCAGVHDEQAELGGAS